MNRLGLAKLTAAQIEVCRLLATGTNRKQIARKRGITMRTVRAHIQASQRVLNCPTEAMLGAAMVQSGLAELEYQCQHSSRLNRLR